MTREKKNICVTLYKDWEKPIGVCIIAEPDDYVCNYDGYMLLFSLEHIDDMIFSYNRNLASVASEIPEEILALRFFESLPLNRSNANIVPTQTYKTEAILKKHEKEYKIRGTKKDNFIISLDLKEANEYRRHTFFNVAVYLNHWYVTMDNFWKITDEDGFLKYRKLPENTKITREKYDGFFTHFHFNDIEDVISRVESNHDGFLNSDGRIIVME